LNGRLDLAQVEGLGDLLAAETEAQQRQALDLMEGQLSRQAEVWRSALVRALAHVEASIDFADEELPDDISESARQLLVEPTLGMQAALDGFRISERLRDGFEVALVGKPNVGKSTLLNHLARRDAALTSPTPGTTRDVIEVRMDLAGLPVSLLDMAGLRSTADAIETLGIDRARQRAARADLRVFLVEPGDRLADFGVDRMGDDLIVTAKADQRRPSSGLAVSGLTGEGVGDLLDGLAKILSGRLSGAVLVSHQRQRLAIVEALRSLGDAEVHLRDVQNQAELASADLHRAVRALEVLVGKSDIEAVLDVIFQNFCLGK
jgi:tRNA modification GTPase